MAVRTKRLAKGTVTTAGGVQVLYTCPADETAIVKDVRVWAEVGAVTRCFLGFRSGTAVAFVDQALANLEALQRQGFVVLQPGEQIIGLANGNNFNYWVSGTELEGVAD